VAPTAAPTTTPAAVPAIAAVASAVAAVASTAVRAVLSGRWRSRGLEQECDRWCSDCRFSYLPQEHATRVGFVLRQLEGNLF
jgi:hypothetical protein